MCYRYLIIAEKFGRELLTNFMLKKSENKIYVDRIIRQLIWGYPEHGYVIDIDEAKRLKLKVIPSSSYPDWNEVWKYFKDHISNEAKIIQLLPEREDEISGEMYDAITGLEESGEVNK
jgi:hypothetical protein